MDFSELVLRISESVDFPLLAAFLIGILAAISPCPLATNIAATAYISRNVTSRWYVATAGMLYTLGRMTTYFIIGALIIVADMKSHRISLSMIRSSSFVEGV